MDCSSNVAMSHFPVVLSPYCPLKIYNIKLCTGNTITAFIRHNKIYHITQILLFFGNVKSIMPM